MRRLLVCVGLTLAVASPAFASGRVVSGRVASGRVPSGVRRVSVTLTFAPTSSQARGPERRTFTKPVQVAEIVKATDALATAVVRGLCPMIMRAGPELTVVYRSTHGSELAEALVQVVNGTKGDSGSSGCFPIHFISEGKGESLVGNSFIRMMGRMLGTAIS